MYSMQMEIMLYIIIHGNSPSVLQLAEVGISSPFRGNFAEYVKLNPVYEPPTWSFI